MSTLTERVVAIADTHTVALLDGHWPCRACGFRTEEVEGSGAFRAHVADWIIAEVREQVAREIESARPSIADMDLGANLGAKAAIREGMDRAARIARGGEGE